METPLFHEELLEGRDVHGWWCEFLDRGQLQVHRELRPRLRSGLEEQMVLCEGHAHGDQEYNLAPFVNGKPENLETLSNKLTRKEKIEVKKLMPKVLEAVAILERESGFTRLVSVFMGHRLQPLQSRPTAMWEYTGDVDESRYGREDFRDQNSLEMAVRGVIKGSKLRRFPTECPVDPFSVSLSLPEVFFCSSRSRIVPSSYALGCGARWKVKRNAKLNWIHPWMEQTVTLERYFSVFSCRSGKAV